MVVLRITLSFNVPIFECANDVTFVRIAQLDLDLVSAIRIGVLQEYVEPSGTRLNSLLVFEDYISKAKDRWIFGNSVLNPPLAKSELVFDRNLFELDISHVIAPSYSAAAARADSLITITSGINL